MDSYLCALIGAYVISAVGMLIASGNVLSNWNDVYHKRAKPSKMTLFFAMWLYVDPSRDRPTQGKRATLWFWSFFPLWNTALFVRLFVQAFCSLIRFTVIEALFGNEDGLRRWRSTALYD